MLKCIGILLFQFGVLAAAENYVAEYKLGQVTPCVKSSVPAAQQIAFIEKKANVKCQLNKSLLLMGLFLKCGESSQMLFRSKQDCEYFSEVKNNKKELQEINLVPPDVKFKPRYLVSYNSCLKRWGDNIQNVGYEKLWNYCDCVSRKLSSDGEERWSKMSKAEVLEYSTNATKECGGLDLLPKSAAPN